MTRLRMCVLFHFTYIFFLINFSFLFEQTKIYKIIYKIIAFSKIYNKERFLNLKYILFLAAGCSGNVWNHFLTKKSSSHFFFKYKSFLRIENVLRHFVFSLQKSRQF